MPLPVCGRSWKLSRRLDGKIIRSNGGSTPHPLVVNRYCIDVRGRDVTERALFLAILTRAVVPIARRTTSLQYVPPVILLKGVYSQLNLDLSTSRKQCLHDDWNR